VVQDFIQVAQVRPFYPEQLAYHVAGKGEPPTRYSINASKAIVHRADSKNDRVLAADICDNISDKGTQGKDYSSLTRVSAPLSFLPDTVYGWCVLILGFFDTLYDIYQSIYGFFNDYLMKPLRAFSFTIFGVHICPFCWLADIVKGILDYLLGPAPPDTRTWHIALVSIACIPAIGYIAKIAGVIDKGIGDIGDIINDIENLQKPGGNGKPAIDQNDSTCNGVDNKNSGGEPGSP
jgi:hypothetical protein